ncbi:hypothetical protein [Xenorhabdus ishibashii]|uniref:N-acetyltransferase domain-containing protein n=1 Tax=Xenorhabdus ishibashii TaxID=1034471 RepID=A0A2D0KJC4_9GAMM|nr:hypothetical protein [Xenorhabdus ishibashii]PHM63543.1 hypothetical protein Xish_02808 [Xenorhabdus ishibashii]
MSKDYQSVVFKAVQDRLKSKYPDPSLKLEYPTEQALQELDSVKNSGNFTWFPSLKGNVFTDSSYLQPDHPIKLVVYYKGQVIGYAFGGYKEKCSSVEIAWMEKRKDAHGDLKNQMLGLALDSYSTYGIFLKEFGYSVDKVAIVSPLEDVKKYYLESGFRYDEDYDNGTPAMILELKSEVNNHEQY